MRAVMQLSKAPDEVLKQEVVRTFEENVAGVVGGSGLESSSVSVRKDLIEWHIRSTDLRLHNKLLELRKRAASALGEKHKLGIRAVTIPELVLEFDLPDKSDREISVPLVESVRCRHGKCTVIIKKFDEEAIKGHYVDRIIRRVHEKIEEEEYAGKSEFWELMWQSSHKKISYEKDPTDYLVERKWVVQGPTKGKWFYMPQMTRLVRAMERIALQEILFPLGFQEIVEPTHEPFDVLMKTGHLEGMPGEFYYVCEPKSRDPEFWEEFRDKVKITRKVPYDDLKDLVSAPRAIGCWVQCPLIYWAFGRQTISPVSLPILVYDKTAISNRYESGGRHGLERVDEFHRIEPVYIGFPDQILELREGLIERYRHVFDEILEIEWRMAWVTPFYMQQTGKIRMEDDEKKDRGTIDYEAYLPYTGSREDGRWLEFQNLSILGDKYTKAFGIKAPKGELWSGCSGIGLERWVIVFLSQKGLDPNNWPRKFSDYVGEIPEEIKIL